VNNSETAKACSACRGIVRNRKYVKIKVGQNGTYYRSHDLVLNFSFSLQRLKLETSILVRLLSMMSTIQLQNSARGV